MIDTFTKEDFEAYLNSNHSPFEYVGLNKGEHTYSLSLDNQTSITIRSSVRDDSLSADVGKDSIRCWLIEKDNKPLGSKISKFTTRVSGWQKRLSKNIGILVFRRSLFGDCKKCGKPKNIMKAKTEKNKGRIFARCKNDDHMKSSFIWLDDAMEFIRENEVYFSKESKNDISKITEENENLLAHSKKQQQSEDIMSFDNANKLSECELPESESKDLQGMSDSNGEIGEREYEKGNNQQLAEVAHNDKSGQDTMQSDNTVRKSGTGNDTRAMAGLPGLSDKKEPNEAQKQAIESELNSDLRVLAGPGSGKTFVMALRYQYLVENGVKPENILVCTFGKEASLEMAKRIQKLVPQANIETICTINALCHRLLVKWDTSSRWYNWKMPKEWQIKKTLEEIIGPVWQEKKKPGVKEVMTYINTTKALGLATDKSYQWFIGVLGPQYGEWLYDIRSKFDAWLNRSRFITYADQLYLVEKKLQSDSQWRIGLQERFSHVIVDEAQDTTYQAMRILITISLEPGMNTVYEVK